MIGTWTFIAERFTLEPDLIATARRVLPAAIALAGAVALVPGWAGAAEVLPGGTLDIELSGEVKLVTSYGDVDEALLDEELSTGLDFFSDAELLLVAEGVHFSTGLEYGAVIEFQAPTSELENTSETWVYLRGDWGEARFGDDNGVSAYDAGIVAGDEGAALSAANVAAGTGGLDADIVTDLFGAPTFEPLGTGEVTKISYVTPKFGGLNVGVSYTPNLAELGEDEGKGDTLALKNVAAGDVVEAIAHYDVEFTGVAVRASLSGLYGDVKNRRRGGGEEEDLADGEEEDLADEDEGLPDGNDYWAAQAGIVVETFGISFGTSYLTEKVGAIEVDAVTFGVGAGFGGDEEDVGGFNVSLNYGQIVRSENLVVEDVELGEPYTLVLSADYGLLPGLVLQGDVAYFDNDYQNGGPGDGKGWVSVMSIAAEF